MAKYYDQVGGGVEGTSSFGKPTILGQARTGGSFWYYYFVALFFKTPVTYIVLFFCQRVATYPPFLNKAFYRKGIFPAGTSDLLPGAYEFLL